MDAWFGSWHPVNSNRDQDLIICSAVMNIVVIGRHIAFSTVYAECCEFKVD
jgi:hypothetical protein